jgi:hypothetical protein
MSEYLNHQCAICGEKYHFCIDCGNAKSFTPWRTIVDTIEHYKIYMVIRDYVNKNIDKVEAKKQLSQCNLSGLENFIPEIKAAIEDIMIEEKLLVNTNNSTKKKTKNVNSIDTPKINI